MIIDISRNVANDLACWPGDEQYTLTHTALIADGHTNNVGVYHGSLHFGTHVDAPYHYDNSGITIEQLDLATYCGPAVVVSATGVAELTMELFSGIDFSLWPRVLIKTDIWQEASTFPEVYPVLAEGVAGKLGALGVKLIGVDLPSVDKFGDEIIRNHYALDRAGILILESVDLSQVLPGVYELISLPLKIVGADGSPVRAVLRTID